MIIKLNEWGWGGLNKNIKVMIGRGVSGVWSKALLKKKLEPFPNGGDHFKKIHQINIKYIEIPYRTIISI